MLRVEIYEELHSQAEPLSIECEFVSLVSPETYGPPALVAPAKDRQQPRARVGEQVVYINTGAGGPAAFTIERISD